jgi:Transposase DDE domain
MMMLYTHNHPQETAMLTISQALHRLKTNLTDLVPQRLIHNLCRDLGRPFRQRTLTPVVTTYLFLRQILHGNTAVGELRHLAGFDFTDSAYCQARARLPLAFFRRLQRAVTGSCLTDDASGTERWHGHRTFLMDGSSFSMPDTEELREVFGQPTGQAAGCGFPTAHLLTLFDAQSGLLLKTVVAPWNTHDLRHVPALHETVQPGDLVVGDRAFGSYAHLALCRRHRLHGLFRAHQRTLIDFRVRRRHLPPGTSVVGQAGVPRSRWLKRLGPRDQLVEYYKPKERPAWMTEDDYAALPESLVVRELRFRVRQPGRRPREITLVTTLTNAQRYTARALAKLYERRWRVEVDLKHLKQSLHLDVLRCQTLPGVMKELLMMQVVYNLVCRVQREAARRQGTKPERISFVDALRWLRQARVGDELPRLKVNRERPGRVEPRVRKRRPKQYALMRKPRSELRKALLGKQLAA